MRTLILLLTVLVAAACARSVRTDNLQTLKRVWHQADEETLVVFDVDEVLITLEDRTRDTFGHPTFRQLAREATAQAVTEEQKAAIEHKLSLKYVLPRRVLVEETTPALIQELQSRGIKTIALTACRTGPYGVLESLERWRIEDLLSFEIDFSQAFPEIDRHLYHDLVPPGARYVPAFEKGCIFSAETPKGKVLKAFLERHQLHPRRVIFVDDLLSNHKSVRGELEPLGIEVISVHYQGARRFLRQTVDDQQVRDQFHRLFAE